MQGAPPRGERGRRSLAFGPLLMALAFSASSGCSDQKAQFAGVWKSNCADYWGVQIRPAGADLYSVTFCGLSGCLKLGEWMPDTRIEGDPMYQVVSATEIRIRRNDAGYFTYKQCSADPFWPVSPPR